MPPTLPPDVARGLLARAQRLAGERGSSVLDTVRAVAGLQAQDAPAAALGVRARRAGSTAAEVDHARFEERSIARTWAMRGTLHLIPAEDVRWMVALLGPVGIRKSRRRIAELRRRPARGDRPRPARRSPTARCTRREVADAVRASGVTLPDDPQVPAWLVGVAALEGHIIEAAPAGHFALTDDWLGPAGRAARPRRRDRRARAPPRPRAPAGRPRGLRGVVGPRAARRPPRLRADRGRARRGRGPRPHAPGSRAASSPRRRTSACCPRSTASCSATATAS